MVKIKKGLIPVMFVFIFVFFLIISMSHRVYSRNNVSEPFRILYGKN